MAAITLAGVHKNFDQVAVLKGIDLEIRDGEFLVLVGPSGCGKSTLLRLIAGLEQPSGGSISIDGQRVDGLAPKDRDLAMVFQSYALYPHMTVRDNMGFALKQRRLPPDLIRQKIDEAAAKLGLTELLDRKPAALSGGQRQRVAMGRAIVRQPKAFLFDEPLSNLDARLREQMRYEIKKLHTELGATSIYVTHDQIEAMTMADRIVAMKDGIAQQIGSPAELYDNPANLFVAGFIGSPAMNFLDARRQSAGGAAKIMLNGLCLAQLPAPANTRGDDAVIVGMRPERIELVTVDAGLVARVDLVEPIGLGQVVHLTIADQRLTLFTTERRNIVAGEAVGLSFHLDDLLLFDPRSGARL
jgi:multiple sugar transport system ATP-binding protein